MVVEWAHHEEATMGSQVDVMTGPRAARRCLAELDEACASLNEGWDENTRRKDIRPGRV